MADPAGRELVFLFSDIESSTQLWERFPDSMQDALARHDAILQRVINKHSGKIIKHTGDGVFALFENKNSLGCAIEIQREISKTDWEEIGQLRVRLAIHAGHAEQRGEDYFGLAINRTVRLLSAGWGGQILVSPEAASCSAVPPQAALINLGTHQLKDLGLPQQIFQIQHPDLPVHEFPPLRTLASRPHNLPTQPTPFLGREQELAEVTAHLRDTPCRLLTLVGPGGIGKTRLALQAAAELIESFAQGVYFVALAPIVSAEFLLSTIADSLGFNFYSSEEPKRQLLDYLREKQLLLVLDNFEHIMEGSALVTEILKSAPKIKLLITSRERLQIQGEWVFRIHGLDYPQNGALPESGDNYSAIELFLQSAERVHSQIVISGDERRDIIRICDLVEGIPLGIELAASWIEVLPIHQIAQEIEKNQDFLITSLKDVPERHRSLRAVFEYSWKLLSIHEQQIFKKLSIFRGPFGREGAEQIAGADLALLSTLVNKSLLRVQSPGRYELLDVLRTYAAEKLSQSPSEYAQTEELHATFYAEFLHQREGSLSRERQREVLEEIRQEIENIRAAWRWAAANRKAELIEKAIQGLYLFYEMRSWFQEGEEVFRQALATWKSGPGSSKNQEKIARKFAVRQGNFCHRLGQNTKARSLLESALSSESYVHDMQEQALILNTLGNVEYTLGDVTQAQMLHQQSLRLREKISDVWAIATSLSNMGVVADRMGDAIEAKKLFQQSLEHRRQLGDRFGIASSLNNLGVLAAKLGELEEARELHQESLAIRRELGDRKGTTESLNNLGVVADALGDYAESRSFYEESLAISKEIGDQVAAGRILNNLGFIAYNLGEYEQAKIYCQQSLQLNRQMKNQIGVIHSLNGLGNAACEQAHFDDAGRHFAEALRAAKEHGQPAEQLEVLLGFAVLFVKRENFDGAIELFELIENHPASDEASRDAARQFLLELPDHVTNRKEPAMNRSINQVISSLLAI